MDQTELKAGTGSGSQQQTDSKGSITQPAVGSSAGGTPISQVQPGVSSSALTSQAGIQLGGQGALPGVSLGQINTSTITKPVEQQAVMPHHINPVLITLPVLLVLIALVSVWQATRSVKSTTGY